MHRYSKGKKPICMSVHFLTISAYWISAYCFFFLGVGKGSKKYFGGTFNSLLMLNSSSSEKDWEIFVFSILLK